MNIKFSYLYRDYSNYKQYGELIFSNNLNIKLSHIRHVILEHLVDGEYFSAEKWKLPSLFFSNQNEDDHEWHEFLNLECTEEISSDLDIKTFLEVIISLTRTPLLEQ